MNDGCPTRGLCQGSDGFGGRWDLAFSGYGDATAIPVPADYDGDGFDDLSIKNGAGEWNIDYAANGFGTWDVMRTGYGDRTAVPVPADYDGDGAADLSVKTSRGEWFVDLRANGFFGWDPACPGCASPLLGRGDATAVPVPADYDGDGRADLSVKNSLGEWYIDYAANGFFGWDPACAGCPVKLTGYGDARAVPVPHNYDPERDAKADLAVKNAAGEWIVNFAHNGFAGGGDTWPHPSGYGGSWSTALPGDYNGDGRTDLAVKDTNGFWFRDHGPTWTGWDADTIDNVHRPVRTPGTPYIAWTRIYKPIDGVSDLPSQPRGTGELTAQAKLQNGHYQLRVGVRYTVAVRLQPGDPDDPTKYGVEVNPDLHVPPSLQLENPVQTTSAAVSKAHTRTFAITCREPGSFPLGFMLRAEHAAAATNPDHGVRVACVEARKGLYGRVTGRERDDHNRLVAGAPVRGAVISVAGHPLQITGADGTWAIDATGGPHRVTISAPGRSTTIAVNVRIPRDSGVEIDTPLEESFTELPSGLSSSTISPPGSDRSDAPGRLSRSGA